MGIGKKPWKHRQTEGAFVQTLRESSERLEALKALMAPTQTERAHGHGSRFGMSAVPPPFPITTSPGKYSKAILPGKGISDTLFQTGPDA